MASSMMGDALLKFWFGDTEGFNQLSWVWLGQWSLMSMLLVCGLITSILWLSWYNARRLSLGRRVTLTLFRVLTLALCFIFFLQPAARLEDVTRVKNHVAVLLDSSRSMSLPSGENMSRMRAAQDEIKEHLSTFKSWGEDHHVDFYHFDTHLTQADTAEALLSLTPKGEATAVIPPLEELLTRTSAQDLAAVIMLSDGTDNRGRLPSNLKAPPSSLIAAIQRLKAPIHTLALGPSERPHDLAIAEVRADDFAFVRNAVSVDVDIRVHGYDRALQQRITLKRGETLLSERVLLSESHKTDYTLSFEFVPEETGEEVYTIELETERQERVTQNNFARFSMRIIRDKIRVLQVVGRPSWDERFLRKHLKQNPNVELISFFILRTNASIETAHPDELSLIPFPTQELFEERLGSFDLMIFQNFTYKGYKMKRYLPLIRDYVKRGGGFVMLGGDQSFSRGGYSGTAIAEMLPFSIPPSRGENVDLGPFNPTLSAAGVRHPITALSLIPEQNREIWSRLPALSGTNQVLEVRGDAQVLAWRPLENGRRTPLIVSSDYGDGRTLAITTDSLWHWAFTPQSSSGDEASSPLNGGQLYHQFWGNSIRWLIRDPALNPIKVRADRERYPLGAPVSLTVKVLNDEYQPLQGVQVQLSIEEVSKGVDLAKEVHRQGVRTQAQGEATLRWTPKEEGAYRARAVAHPQGASLSAQDLFIVAEDPLEYREVTPRPQLLSWLSEASGGEVLSAGQQWRDLKRITPKVMKVNRRKDLPLWSGVWPLALALFFPVVEWALRRRWGLT